MNVYLPDHFVDHLKARAQEGETPSKVAARLLAEALAPTRATAAPAAPAEPETREQIVTRRNREQALQPPKPAGLGGVAHVAIPARPVSRGAAPANRRSAGVVQVTRVPTESLVDHPCKYRLPQLPPNADPSVCAGTCQVRSRRTDTKVPCLVRASAAAPYNEQSGAGCRDFAPRL